MKRAIVLDNVSKRFGNRVILKEINFTVFKGDRVIIKGPNGSGKTTLLKIMAGIIKPDLGTVIREGKLSFSFQEPIFLPWLSMGENLTLVSKDKRYIEYLLHYFGLYLFRELRPEELSGGYQQIFSFIRAFLDEPDIVILDEPFKSLDSEMKEKAKNFLLDYINEKKITLLMVSHQEEEEDFEIGTRLIYLRDSSMLLERKIFPVGVSSPRDALALKVP